MSFWKLAVQRLRYEPGLSLALLAGWVAAVALVTAVPMYTDAINQALLRKELGAETTSHRPAFGLLFHYTKSTRDAPWEPYLALEHYVRTDLAADLALPLQTRLHYGKSDLFQFFPAQAGTYERGNDPLSRVHLGFLGELEQLVTLVEGHMPAAAWSPGEPIEVLVNQALAETLGLQVGEIYILFNVAGVEGAATSFSQPVRISGVWQPADATAQSWYIPPSAFDTTLLVPQASYLSVLRDQIPQPLYDVGWYLLFDGGAVRAESVAPFLDRMAQVESRVAALLPGARLTLSPAPALRRYQATVSAQALLILLLGLPVIGLILLFIGLIAGSMVERQQLEIAILKSRGGGNGQIALLFLWQGITLCVLALVLGLPAGWLAAYGIGSARAFLTFERITPLIVAITNESVRYGLGAVVVALAVTIAPALRAARQTVVTARQRTVRRGWWLPLAADLLILAVAAYGYYLLIRQGSFAQAGPQAPPDPWENPLLFVTPSLFLLAGARLYIHLAPALLVALEWLATQLPGITALLSLRNLARHHRQHQALITLLLLTAGLGAYVTSFARTADENLLARTAYRVGAPVAVVEAAGQLGASLTANPAAGSSVASNTVETDADLASGLPGWAILPVTEHYRVEGVRAVARVGRFQATVRTANELMQGELYGIDREDFPKVAYFRRDFAPHSLGALMNALALEPAGLLVTRNFVEQTTLSIGDSVALTGLIAGTNQPLTFKIVGVFDLFPTAYPDERPVFVANLEYIFTELGGPLPYYVWLAVDEGLTADSLSAGLEAVGFTILQIDDVRQIVAAEQARPERIGLFGFFSLGFLVTTLLGILALVTHASLVYQRRFVQLGILRAIGLSSRQVALAQAGEFLFVTIMGIVGGAWLGLLCSDLFIPFMQVGSTPAELVPPLVVVIAWQDVVMAVVITLGAALLVAGAVAWLLARLQMFQAIKLGETLNS
jgi:putative ABC transport system permease protein